LRNYRYLHLDVFTETPFTGNQLAVFVDAAGLDSDLMQAIAREMAFPETTFIFPAETSDTDVRVRIFTPSTELPMAGHPTIGTTFALAHEGRIHSESAIVMLGLGVGPTPVSLEWESDRLQFAWMTQPAPEFGSTLTDIKRLASALALEEGDIRDTTLPVQVVSSGVPFLFVPLVSRAAVNAAVLDRGAVGQFCQAANLPEIPVFVFSLEKADDDATVFSRMFAPVFGIPEDPATGGASGPLGSYLVHHRAVPAEQAVHMVSLQGVKMGRPSRIHISISARDGLIDRVRVGGQSVLVGEGMIQV
jgi:trans-2,3-dihydro-3-hydroxyanthranilate isomerase